MSKKISKLVLLLITVFLIISLAGCGTTDNNNTNTQSSTNTANEPVNPEEGYSLFTSSDNKISFVYDNDWTSIDGSAQGLKQVFMAPDNSTNLSYLTETLPTAYTVKEYADASKAQLQSYLGIASFSKDEAIKVGPRDGYEVEYDFSISDQDTISTKIKQVFMVVDNLAYVFTYTATSDNFNTHLNVANKMIDSIRIK